MQVHVLYAHSYPPPHRHVRRLQFTVPLRGVIGHPDLHRRLAAFSQQPLELTVTEAAVEGAALLGAALQEAASCLEEPRFAVKHVCVCVRGNRAGGACGVWAERWGSGNFFSLCVHVEVCWHRSGEEI